MSDLDLGVGAAAFALDEDGLGVVQQAVQQGRSEDGVVLVDAGPMLEHAVGRQYRRTALVVAADDL